MRSADVFRLGRRQRRRRCCGILALANTDAFEHRAATCKCAEMLLLLTQANILFSVDPSRSAHGEQAILRQASHRSGSRRKAPPKGGQSMSALPNSSNLNLFCYRNRIVNFDAQIANGAFDFGMPEQQLNGTQVPGSSVDQRGFGSAQRMCAE